MQSLIFILIPVSFLIAFPATWIILRLSLRVGALDTQGVEGQTKSAARSIPNTGGIAIALGILIPMACAAIGGVLANPESLPAFLDPIQEHIPGLRSQLPLGLALLGSLFALHILGVVDDRRPMGPWVKLLIMIIPGFVFATFFDTRLMTILDQYVGGSWLSIIVTVLWFTAIINAMNFIDNMDGLSAGIAVIAGSLLLIAALLNGQWFVGAITALLVGSVLGFLVFNFPPAKIFMGDGGSLIIGLLLAFITVRMTYIPIGTDPNASLNWYTLMMPIIVLIIPLYDFTSVTCIRIYQGKSPFVGDLQHFSHRIHQRGLGSRSTILVIYALTLASGISGLLLINAQPWQAFLLGFQIFAMILAIALFEYRSPAQQSNAESSEQE